MFVSTVITSIQSYNIHPKSSPPQIPILCHPMSSHTMMSLSLSPTIQKPLTHQKPIQSNRFRNLTLTLLMKQVFFHDIVACGTERRPAKARKVCGLTVLTMCVNEVLEEES